MAAVVRVGRPARAQLAFPTLVLGLLPVLLAAAAAGEEDAGAGETITELHYTHPWPSVAGFDEIYRRDGVVLLQLMNRSGDTVKDGLELAETYLAPPTEHQPKGLWHEPMAEYDGEPMNPNNDTKMVSPHRKRYTSHNTLAPADESAQGPHQEGATCTRGNRRVLVFLCESPSLKGGGTAVFDMARAWELLSETMRQTLRRSYWVAMGHDGVWSGPRAKIPAVVRHDITGRPCLQFYCFGRVARDCVEVYREKTSKFHVRQDVYGYAMHPDADVLLEDESGRRRPFIGLELYQLLSAIYDTMIMYQWHAGDQLFVDNVRWAHARLEGVGAGRKVHFAIYGPPDRSFDLQNFERP